MLTMALGFILGFVGYLPPGNINLAVVQLAINHSSSRLWGFILFATIMEFLYCLGCLTGLDLLMQQPHLVIVMQWLAVFIFAALGLLSFFHDEQTVKIPALSGLGRGIFAAVINPLQIPYWLVWGVYLNGKLRGGFLSLTVFSIITAIGTTCILWVYAVGGKKLIENMKWERRIIDRVIGLLLIALAIIQLIKLLHTHH